MFSNFKSSLCLGRSIIRLFQQSPFLCPFQDSRVYTICLPNFIQQFCSEIIKKNLIIKSLIRFTVSTIHGCSAAKLYYPIRGRVVVATTYSESQNKVTLYKLQTLKNDLNFLFF